MDELCVCGHERREHSLKPERCRYTHVQPCEQFEAAADMPEDLMTDQEIANLLNDWHSQGLFDYVLLSEPLGREWIVGQDGQILKMNTKQVIGFISGANCVLRTFAKRAGMLL